MIHGFVDAGDEPVQRGGCAGSAFLVLRPRLTISGASAPAIRQHLLGKRGVSLLQSKCPACTRICENHNSSVGEA